MAINPDDLALKFAAQVGKDKQMYELAREAGGTIFDQVAALMDELIKEINKNAPMASANLQQSWEPDVLVQGNSFFFRLLAADYYDYINKGVNGKLKSQGSPYSFKGKMPPVSALEQWAAEKGINKWALQRSIFEKGIKGTGYFDKAVKKVLG